MSSPAYRALIDAFCRAAGLGDAGELHRTGNLRLGDVDFTLLPVAHPQGDLVLVYADFGPVPAHAREQALQRLLELNLLLYGGEGPGFSFNRESGHVLLMAQLRLGTASPEAVLGVVRSMALFAQRWRADHFLAEESAVPLAGAHAQQRPGRTPFSRN
jgi:hypothetical protein